MCFKRNGRSLGKRQTLKLLKIWGNSSEFDEFLNILVLSSVEHLKWQTYLTVPIIKTLQLSCEVSKTFHFFLPLARELLNPSYLFLITFCPIFLPPARCCRLLSVCMCHFLCSNKTLVCSIHKFEIRFEAFMQGFVTVAQASAMIAPRQSQAWAVMARDTALLLVKETSERPSFRRKALSLSLRRITFGARQSLAFMIFIFAFKRANDSNCALNLQLFIIFGLAIFVGGFLGKTKDSFIRRGRNLWSWFLHSKSSFHSLSFFDND